MEMLYTLKSFFTALVLAGFLSCTSKATQEAENLSVIAFGSCNHQDKEQPLWQSIADNDPDLWVWLGDNIYGDTEDMDVLREKYALQKNNPEYKKLLNACPVIGIWDDHDYGKNDAGTEYSYKAESQQIMLDFLDEPQESKRRGQKGAYASYVYGKGENQVKIILLDGRYHRDAIDTIGKGDILGLEQWTWLEKELIQSKAAINIIGCGIQFIPEQHPYEKWANFPEARMRLFKLIGKSNAKGVFLLSGDRHIAEISKYEGPEVPYPIYDITSSGLTHAHTGNEAESNKYRVGALVNNLNFGVMEIDWSKSPLEVDVHIKGIDNEVLESHLITFDR